MSDLARSTTGMAKPQALPIVRLSPPLCMTLALTTISELEQSWLKYCMEAAGRGWGRVGGGEGTRLDLQQVADQRVRGHALGERALRGLARGRPAAKLGEEVVRQARARPRARLNLRAAGCNIKLDLSKSTMNNWHDWI